MKIRFIVPFVICIVMMIGTASSVWGSTAAPSIHSFFVSSSYYEQLNQLDETANSLYEAAFTNNRQAGYLKVQQLQRMVEGDLKYAAGKREGWLSITKDASSIQKKLASGQVSSGWMQEAARIKLAVDALVRPEHALWLQYETIMMEDLSLTEKAWKRQTGDAAAAARATMNKLQEHAERIEPVINLLYGSRHGAELKERIRYTNLLLESNTAGAANKSMVNQSLKAVKESIMRLYDQSLQAAAMPAAAPIASANPISWALLLGTVISAVLAYSGWRKYKLNPYGIKPLL